MENGCGNHKDPHLNHDRLQWGAAQFPFTHHRCLRSATQTLPVAAASSEPARLQASRSLVPASGKETSRGRDGACARPRASRAPWGLWPRAQGHRPGAFHQARGTRGFARLRAGREPGTGARGAAGRRGRSAAAFGAQRRRFRDFTQLLFLISESKTRTPVLLARKAFP